MSMRQAPIIANYEYKDAGLQKLIAPAQDAEALARVFNDPNIGGFEVQSLLNEHSHNLRQEIETFVDDRKQRSPVRVF